MRGDKFSKISGLWSKNEVHLTRIMHGPKAEVKQPKGAKEELYFMLLTVCFSDGWVVVGGNSGHAQWRAFDNMRRWHKSPVPIFCNQEVGLVHRTQPVSVSILNRIICTEQQASHYLIVLYIIFNLFLKSWGKNDLQKELITVEDYWRKKMKIDDVWSGCYTCNFEIFHLLAFV